MKRIYCSPKLFWHVMDNYIILFSTSVLDYIFTTRINYRWQTHGACFGIWIILSDPDITPKTYSKKHAADPLVSNPNATEEWQSLAVRSSSSSLPVECVKSSSAMVGLMGCRSWLSAARLSLCLVNLSTSCVSLERFFRITSLACVLLLELISKIV